MSEVLIQKHSLFLGQLNKSTPSNIILVKLFQHTSVRLAAAIPTRGREY